jgi:MFS family permease
LVLRWLSLGELLQCESVLSIPNKSLTRFHRLQAAAFNWQGMMTARFFLGVFEASFTPGIALYLSYFYPRYQYGLRFGIYVSAAALASSFAGALAYGLVHATSSKIATWYDNPSLISLNASLTVPPRRLLFIVGRLINLIISHGLYLSCLRFITEGLPTVLIAPVVYLFLPNCIKVR